MAIYNPKSLKAEEFINDGEILATIEYAEQNKVAIRNIRRDALDEVKKLKKDNAISEDEEKKAETEIQKITDEAVKKIDEMQSLKEKDIMQV